MARATPAGPKAAAAQAIMRADRHHPGHRQVDLAEQDDQHHAGGDDAEERGDLQLLQQIFGRQEARRIEAAEDQQQR